MRTRLRYGRRPEVVRRLAAAVTVVIGSLLILGSLGVDAAAAAESGAGALAAPIDAWSFAAGGFATGLAVCLAKRMRPLLRGRRREERAAVALAEATARADASETRFRDYAEAASDWFWEAGPDGRLTYLSAGIARFGFQPAELVGARRAQLPYTVPSGQPGVAAIAAATANRTAFKDVEFEGVLRDGRRALIAVSGRPVFDAQERYIGHRGTGRDVTEARRREHELERQSRLLDTIVNTMGEGISVFDHDGRLVAWNQRFIELSGATGVRDGITLREILRNQACAGEFGPCNPDEEADRRIVAHWERRTRVLERQRPNGRTIELRRDAIAGGGIVTIYVDITQRKEQERRLAETIAKEREVAAEQRRFVTVAAHEFRTPLTIIDGSAQLLMRLAEEAGLEAVDRRAQKIRAAVSRMAMLIDTMLNSARLDAGRIVASFSTVDVVALIEGVARRQSGIAPDFTIKVASNLPSLEIEADPPLLDQVFSNLLANAIKYSGTSRRIDVSVSRAADAVDISVRDYGIGIPAAEIPKLFTRFFRASTAKGLPGTGIGLNLARELVALHGGTVAVDSDVAEGSCFKVTLPLVATRAARAPTSPTAA
ncbi:MAG: PAS-domain containing protein [Alphaproteobacteria bacterium]|nr:PAS-domain containing protein [Alphaproteobacteria bacterium]